LFSRTRTYLTTISLCGPFLILAFPLQYHFLILKSPVWFFSTFLPNVGAGRPFLFCCINPFLCFFTGAPSFCLAAQRVEIPWFFFFFPMTSSFPLGSDLFSPASFFDYFPFARGPSTTWTFFVGRHPLFPFEYADRRL